MAAEYRWHGAVPGGSDDDWKALRQALAGYDEAAICGRLGVPNLQVYRSRPEPELAALPVQDQLDALIRLFVDCVYLQEESLAPQTAAVLLRLGLIARAAERPGAVWATAAILPAAGELTVCDRGSAPDGSRGEMPPDVVYPAVFENTRRFLASLPATPCDAMLDIGTGTGIAAIVQARCSREVWATDIAARSVEFARVNCRLAGVANVTVVEGDMYTPVEGRTFDRIAIHPPYVPARRSKFVFRDAGEDGSEIIRRAVEGLPQFLRPGGRFYATLLAFDREGQSFEQRVRGWLGELHSEFDIGMAAYSAQAPQEFLAQYFAKGPVELEDARFWMEMWEANRASQVVYGSLTIARHEDVREAVDARVQPGNGYHPAMLEELIAWESAARGADGAERLLACRPKASAQLRLKTSSRMAEGKIVVESMAVEARGPFRASLGCDWWLPQVLAQCDGAKSWRELYEWAHGGQWIPESLSAAEFAQLLLMLLRKGFVERPGKV